MPKPLLVIGSVHAELAFELARLPRGGEIVAALAGTTRPGGRGALQAMAAVRLGQQTWFAGNLGDDAHAPGLREALAAAGLGLELLHQVEGPSGQAVILVQADGLKAIVVHPGANLEWYGPRGANRAWNGLSEPLASRIAEAGVLLLDREIPDEVNGEASGLARHAGVPVVLDAGGADRPVPAPLLARIEVLVTSQGELARLSGQRTESHEQALAAVQILQRQGAGAVLVKLGARGALLVERNGAVLRQPAFKVEVVDASAAGDCLAAAYA
ncbi:MAG: hypothetical protein H0X38_12150, partial [Planctomycetes bacterium]|nr:hypothetical protein [Planctomycetota bacterium]